MLHFKDSQIATIYSISSSILSNCATCFAEGGKATYAAAASKSKSIWSIEEVDALADNEEVMDPRKRPIFDILYKQSVGTEDLYLGLSGLTPLTADCNVLVVKVRYSSSHIMLPESRIHPCLISSYL